MPVVRNSSGSGVSFIGLWFVVIFLALNVFLMVLLYTDRRVYVREYQLDHDVFKESVVQGVTNYLSTFSPFSNTNSPAPSPVSNQPLFLAVPGCYYEDFRGRPHAYISGIDYLSGDYSPWGWIELITEKGLYCTLSNRFQIVRFDMSSGAAFAASEREESEQGTL